MTPKPRLHYIATTYMYCTDLLPGNKDVLEVHTNIAIPYNPAISLVVGAMLYR